MNTNKDKELLNLLTKTTALAMNITLQYIKEGDTVVDATAGNGKDTVALAEAVGAKGRVAAFDIQEDALKTTEKLLEQYDLQKQCVLINDSHENMDKYISEEASAVIFNFGYLPGGSKALTTKAASSLKAIEKGLKLIKKGGIMTLVVYSGHEEGREEKAEILKFAASLPPKEFHVAYTSMINQGGSPPEIIWITRKI